MDIFAELNDEGDVIGYSLSQESYIAELLRSHDVKPNARATAPVPKDWVRELPQEEDFSEADLRAAQRITGELLWLGQRSRVDIGYSVGLMASWVAKFPLQVSKIGFRVLEYLANTRADRLMLIPGRPEGLRIFTDASFAPHGGHSISGVVLQYDECCIVWKSKRQSLVTLSTAESELVAGCEGVVLSQSLAALICELQESTCRKHLMIDNTAAVTLANGEGSQRTRHLRVESAFIRDMIDREEMDVSHCPGDLQLADCLTKALLKSRLDHLNGLLGSGPPRTRALPQVSKIIWPGQLPQEEQGEPDRSTGPRPTGGAPVGVDRDRIALWLVALLLLLQADLSEASQEEEVEAEPLSLELSLLVVLMILSVLFLWESARYCLKSCCARQDDDHVVRMLSADDEPEPSTRRERRQEAVRRAIVNELQGEGVRRRSAPAQESGVTTSVQPGTPYLRVQVEAQQGTATLSVPPPPPPASSSSVSIPEPTPDRSLGLPGLTPIDPIPPPPFLASEPRSSPRSGLGGMHLPKRILTKVSLLRNCVSST